MVQLFKLLARIIDFCHDQIVDMFRTFGLHLSDKDLHFVIIGLAGIAIFIGTQILFKWLSKHSITAISFIYTFTVLVVIVFAIEIEQKITGSGNMEFADVLYGLYGFLFLFAIYLFIKSIIAVIKKIRAKKKQKKDINVWRNAQCQKENTKDRKNR